MILLFPTEISSGSLTALEYHLAYHQLHSRAEGRSAIPFLDALMMRKEDRTLEKSVYRRHTHTDCHLPYGSHHPLHVKKSVVRTIMKRAQDITQRTTFSTKNSDI